MTTTQNQTVGIIGARSPVGERLLPMLVERGYQVIAFSRQPVSVSGGPVEWRQLPTEGADLRSAAPIANWISIAHIWVLPDYFAFLTASGARRVVAISSTSRFTKVDSATERERETADKLLNGEDSLTRWAQANQVAWTVLRPTLIYGDGKDRNLSDVAAFIKRTGVFPLLGAAKGLRQPVHTADVASACASALEAPLARNKAYNISGGEVLTYRDMVARVFQALDRKPRFVPIPAGVIKVGIGAASKIPRFRHWTPSMADRMNRDMVFDHDAAYRDFGFAPRPFQVGAVDVGRDGR